LRALLSAFWIKQNNSMSSIEFNYLLHHLNIDTKIIIEIEELVKTKSKLTESEFYKISPNLTDFVESRFDELEGYFPEPINVEKINWNSKLREVINKLDK
jgi:predicted nucleotidyltransferase